MVEYRNKKNSINLYLIPNIRTDSKIDHILQSKIENYRNPRIKTEDNLYNLGVDEFLRI